MSEQDSSGADAARAEGLPWWRTPRGWFAVPGHSPWRWRARLGVLAILFVPAVWATAALAIDCRVPLLRVPLAILYVLATLAVIVLARWPRQALMLGLAGFALVLVWWFSLCPSNDRDWQPDVAVPAYAEFAGNQVTIHNIRNCDYRTETDYDVRYETKTFDLNQLDFATLYLVYWGSPNIAHTMMSFGFADGSQVCISVETRKEKGEEYSTFKGLFRQFELVYIVANERDLVRLRTNYRKGEIVYLYHINVEREIIRQAFVDYLNEVNSLSRRAEWYNVLTSNCTTNIRGHTAPYTKARWRWQVLLTGHVDEMAYQNGALDQSLPFVELKPLCLINAKAQKADTDPQFSRRIREGVPGFQPTSADPDPGGLP